MDRKSSPRASDRPAKRRRDSREGRDDDRDIDRGRHRNEPRQGYDGEGSRSHGYDRRPEYHQRGRSRGLRSRSRSRSPRSRSWRNRTRKSRSESWERQEHDQRGRQDYGEHRSGPANHRRHGYEEYRKHPTPPAQNSSRSTAMPSSQCPSVQSRRSTLVPAPSHFHFPLKPCQKDGEQGRSFKHRIRLPRADEAQVTITLPELGHSIAPLGAYYIDVTDGLKFNCTLDPGGVWSFNDGVHVLGLTGGCLVMPEHDSIIYDDLTKTFNINAGEELFLWPGCVVSIRRFAPSLYPILDSFRLYSSWHVPHGGMILKDSRTRLPGRILIGPEGMTASDALELTRDTLIPGLAPPGVPGGQNVPGGTLLAKGTLIPANISLAGGTRLANSTLLLGNISIPGGTILPNNSLISAGSRFPRGTSFPPMRCLFNTLRKFFPGGVHWPDGGKLLDDNDNGVEASRVLAADGAKARTNEGDNLEKNHTIARHAEIAGLQRESKDKGEKSKKLDDEETELDDKYGKPRGKVRKLGVEDDKTNLQAELARLQQEARIKDEKIKQLDAEKKKANQAAQKREEANQAAQKREDELRQEARIKDDKIQRLDTEMKKVDQAARKREDELQQEARTKDDKIKRLDTERKKANQSAQKREEELQELQEELQRLKDKLRTSADDEVAKGPPDAAKPTNDSRGSGSGDKEGGDDDDEVALFRFPGDRDGEGDSGGQIGITLRVVRNRRSRSNQRPEGRVGRRR